MSFVSKLFFSSAALAALVVVQFGVGTPTGDPFWRKSAILSRLRSILRLALIGAIFASWSTASFAIDPLVLFLLKMLRDQVISSSLEAGYDAAREAYNAPPVFVPPAVLGMPPSLPPGATESERLTALIDESFIHLTPQQREELYGNLMKIVNDPGNAAQRQVLIAQFTIQANNLRDAHRILGQMSDADMRGVVAQARREYEKLPAEQREQMLQVLRRGIPGVPRSLSEMMLAEFSGAGG